MTQILHEVNVKRNTFRLSLDAWAVIVAFVLALAVRFDIFKKVPW